MEMSGGGGLKSPRPKLVCRVIEEKKKKKKKKEEEEEKITATVAHLTGGKPLFLLEVNFRSSYYKTSDPWNLTHITLVL